MDTMGPTFSEPPPLLSAPEFARIPLEALPVNSMPDHMGRDAMPGLVKKAPVMKRSELQDLLSNAMSEVVAKSRSWDMAVGVLETRFNSFLESSRYEKDALKLKMQEIHRKVRTISEAIDHHMVYLPHLTAAVNILKEAMAADITRDSGLVIGKCTNAKGMFEELPRTGHLPGGYMLPHDVQSILGDHNRTDLVYRNAQPANALIAICCTYIGHALKAQGKYDEAASKYFQALDLVKDEEGAENSAAQELVGYSHACMQLKLDEAERVARTSGTAAGATTMAAAEASPTQEPPAPSTPPTSASSRRQHFYTPPPARCTVDIDSEFARGAVTPGTGPNWESSPGAFFGFPRQWMAERTPTPSPPPSRPKIKKECYQCGTRANLKVCSQCKKVCFCSVACQTKAWEERHSAECQPEGAAGQNTFQEG